jgi:hypothetical protein
MKAKVYVNQDKSVSDLQTLIQHSFLLYFPRELLMNFLKLFPKDIRYIVLYELTNYGNNLYTGIIFIIYRPGARGIRRNISRSDDIFRGALPRGKYHH